jgi:hypothetical protein
MGFEARFFPVFGDVLRHYTDDEIQFGRIQRRLNLGGRRHGLDLLDRRSQTITFL